jgi:hypothetical protein
LGSYTLTGFNAAIRTDRRILAVQGAYSLTGNPQTLARSIPILAAQGSYSLSGQVTVFAVAHRITAAQGSYTLTGNAQSLRHAYPVLAALGTYALNGQAQSFIVAHRIAAAQGSYSLTGNVTGFQRIVSMAAAFGTYNFSGMDAVLSVGAPTVPWGGTVKKILPITPTGLVKWVDYIPIKMYPSTLVENVNRTNDLGALASETLTIPEGVAWVNYLPVAHVTDPESKRWRTDDTGFIPFVETS